MFDNSSHTGTLVDFAIVPAPGAVALLGMAGLVGGRRRRA
jgi:xanthosine utilization system XapX-like protein